MENKLTYQQVIKGWTILCRFFLSVVFIFSGFVKAIDPLGTQYKISDYMDAFGWGGVFPDYMLLGASILLGMLEFCLGVYLFFGIRRIIAPRLLLLIMGVMTPLTLWLAIKNPISDCGCFGDAVVLTNWETFWKNVFLLIAAISVFKWRKMIFPLVTVRFDWLIGVYAFLYIASITVYCYHNLPIFDFRPYRIGADIRKNMEVPEGEELTSYETIYLLEKNGVKKEFTADNYPDSTWHFVDSKTVVVKEGYEPPINEMEFSIISNDTFEDITDEILADEGYTFLLISHQVELADDSSIDLINELYDYCLLHDYRFYCLTSSYEEGIMKWQDRTGAEYPFATLDNVVLRTIIRSNPGLLLLKKGVVINKWSVNNLPDEYQLTGPLEELPIGKLNPDTLTRKIVLVLAWFILPLLMICMIDLWWDRHRRNKRININE